MTIKYGEKYPGINSLLLYFLMYGEEEEPVWEDEKIIKKFSKDIRPNQLKQTISEGKEVLDLEPFPEDWIWDIAGGHSRPWSDNSIKSCHDWLEWVIRELEKQYNEAPWKK